MAATPLATLVLLSQRRTFLRAERSRLIRESVRAERKATSAASKACAAADEATLVLLSQRRTFLRAERSRLIRKSVRAERKATSAASKACAAADEAYLAEGYRVLHQRTVAVHSLQEIEALIALLESSEVERPYRLKSVTVNAPVPTAEMMELEVEQMRESLEAAEFELVEGNTYALPNTVEE